MAKEIHFNTESKENLRKSKESRESKDFQRDS